MCGQNKTDIMELILLGFRNLQHLKDIIFALFLLFYVISLTGNFVIIHLITNNRKLHSPMYFFLWNLSACEILFTTIIMPNMLYVVWREGGSMSWFSCLTQFYLGASVGCAECLLLTVMTYDRYLAICNPLRYSSLMNIKTRNNLTLWSWLSAFLVMIILTVSICNLRFCSFNTIDHLFCDLAPILQLSLTDTYVVEMESMVITVAFSLLPFTLIILSYVSIFFTILNISSRSGRQKTFSTCSSHLLSVCTYFGTIFIIYLVPSQQRSAKLDKSLSLLYSVGTPLLNPIIYSLRNEEMKQCIKALFTPKEKKPT
ncbi:olfactory receptor 10A3-like [Hyperolius riggenbachi]|uniref:olfactory receptor 10A3-like n=1 Tax=Hyperolius riggenbachi TaxID=752182 RepID=UPI0035A31600